MKKLTFEEWQKKYGRHEVTTVFTDEERVQAEEKWKKQEQERYDLYCRKVGACNKDWHSNKTYREVISETKTDVFRYINNLREIEKDVSKDQMWSVLKKLEQVEEKNRCLRVRMLDWLSDLFADWSKRCHERSVKIDSPCAIKLPDNNKKVDITQPPAWLPRKMTVEEYDKVESKKR